MAFDLADSGSSSSSGGNWRNKSSDRCRIGSRASSAEREFLERADQLQEVDVLASSSPTWCTSLSTCSATTIADRLQKVDMFGVWAALRAPACISSRFIAIIGITDNVDAETDVNDVS